MLLKLQKLAGVQLKEYTQKSSIKMVYTGKRAEQLIKGRVKIEISRSRHEAMVRVASTEGTAQAVLLINGIMDLPLSPKGLNTRSIIIAARVMYPLSSKKAMQANKMAI